jgi:FkbM family methyltransferase
MGASFAFHVGEPETAFLRKRLSDGDTVYDVGANVGRYTLHFSDAVGSTGHVVALEPVEDLSNTLRQNVALNGIDNVSVVSAAAANKRGTADFAYTPEKMTLGMLERPVPDSYQPKNTDTIKVLTVRLDDVAEELGAVPEMIKLDVQGGAATALQGASRILDAYEPDVFIELHGPEEQQAVHNELIGRGYTAWTLDGKIIEDVTARWTSPLWCTKQTFDSCGKVM